MADKYRVFLNDGSSYLIPSVNVENTRRLVPNISHIQKEGEEDLSTIEDALNEPLIKDEDYSLKELKKLAKERFEIDFKPNIKKADLLDLVNKQLS